MPSPVSEALAEMGVPHREFVHPGPVNSLEQAAEERGQRPEQVIRSILFRLGEGQYAMALMAGPRQVDWKTLRQHFGQSRLTMASAEEVMEVTGYVVGSVSPFGLPQPVPVLIDEQVLAQEEVSIGSGVRGTTIFIKTADLLAALPDAETGRFGKA
jgi:Cys-tRNA(Pro)/Cys-tRNA(Cys) deacylase